MARPRQKPRSRWLSVSQYVVVLAGTLAIYAIVAFSGRALDSLKTRERLEGLHADVVRLETEQVRLQEELRRVKGPEAVERVAREELGMVKPGESPVKVATVAQPLKGEAGAQPAATAQAVPKPPGLAHWQEWWDLLLGPAGPRAGGAATPTVAATATAGKK